MASEYVKHGQFSIKFDDVFSFSVLVLEIISGKKRVGSLIVNSIGPVQLLKTKQIKGVDTSPKWLSPVSNWAVNVTGQFWVVGCRKTTHFMGA